MPTLMSTSNFLALGPGGVILNANLYFFSWLGLIGAALVFSHYLQTALKLKGGVDFAFMAWAGLVLTSLVVMVSAARMCENSNCTEGDSDYQRRTQFAIALGCIRYV